VTALVRRALGEKRALIWPLAAALVVNIAMYAFVVYPLGRRSAGAADRAVAAASAVRVAQREHDLARELVAGKSRADVELQAFYSKVLPSNLTAARRMTYASLPSLARATNVRFEQRRFNVEDTDEDGGLGRLVIRMVLQGDYEDIRDFIYRLESAPEFIVLDDVTLTENASDAPPTLTINLSTYFVMRADGT
jgi:hypothetical protein